MSSEDEKPEEPDFANMPLDDLRAYLTFLREQNATRRGVVQAKTEKKAARAIKVKNAIRIELPKV